MDRLWQSFFSTQVLIYTVGILSYSPVYAQYTNPGYLLQKPKNSYNKIVTGATHSCGINATGSLRCWGSNSSGQIGNNSAVAIGIPLLQVVDPTSTYQQVTAGSLHSCGITSAGLLKCWGLNTSSQLGNNTTTQSLVPVPIDSGTPYAQIAAGASHTCGITASTASPANTIKCWGANTNGQIGDNTSTSRLTPIPIDSGTPYAQVATGGTHTCGITTAGALKCWGANTYGQLGNNSITQNPTPVVIDNGVTYSQISGGGSHTCGITTAAALKCWGANTNGQLGNNSGTQSIIPIVIDSGVTYSQISAGGTHTCGITTAGALKCWGLNTSSQLGNNTTTQSLIPVVIEAGTSYSRIAAGGSHTCGITAPSALPPNAIKCWGSSINGQLGNGTTTTKSVPTTIDPGTSYL